MKPNSRLWLVGMLAAGLSSEAAQPTEGYVTREEYNQLLMEVQALRQQIDRQPPKAAAAGEEAFDELETEIGRLKQATLSARPGENQFLVTGYSFASFTDEEGAPSDFTAGLRPLLLFKLGNRVLVESEIEMNLEEGGETEVELEYAQLTYLLSDYATVGAGKFLLPFGAFGERLHPAWVNKLPDAPRYWEHHGGFAPMTGVGAQLRGGIPLGGGRLTYSTYLINGPQLIASGHDAGDVAFGSAGDNNGDKAFGARVGLVLIPGMELGLSMLTGDASMTGDAPDDMLTGDASMTGDASEDQVVGAKLWAADFGFARTSKTLAGTIDLRAEYARSDVDRVAGILAGGENVRKGWYTQVAYRPDVLRTRDAGWEVVARLDSIDLPAIKRRDQKRWTFGLNYWLNPSTVFKAAYRFDDNVDPGREVDAFLGQFAIGF